MFLDSGVSLECLPEFTGLLLVHVSIFRSWSTLKKRLLADDEDDDFAGREGDPNMELLQSILRAIAESRRMVGWEVGGCGKLANIRFEHSR